MEIEHLSPEEIQKEINAILAKYPVLEDFEDPDSCCSCCTYSVLGRNYGWEVAAAWDELEGYRYLLS